MERFRWGILGTGVIANKFAAGLTEVPDAALVAVGSRSRESAELFAARWNVPRRHTSYCALAEDPEVDAIYVSTPHNFHHEHTLLCLRGGKAVLCEKPFAVNLREAEAMVREAQVQRRFLMEAMWTRFQPVTARVRELLALGAIGEPRMFTCDLGFRADFDPTSRLFDPRLAGGALLDVGVYCVSYASMVFQRSPDEIVGLAQRGSTGVDEQSAWIQRYENGALAVLSSAVRTNTPIEAAIHGTHGSIRVPHFYDTDHLFLNGERENHEHRGNGFCYEAMEVQRAVRTKAIESPLLRHEESLDVMRTLDRIRAQWGLRYPADDSATL